MKKFLLAAALLPRIYFMEVEVQKELGIDSMDLSKYELTCTTSMDLVTATSAKSIILLADLVGDECGQVGS